jgi:hypothetical protein
MIIAKLITTYGSAASPGAMLWVGPKMRLKSVVFWELIVTSVYGERHDHDGAERACSHQTNAATSATRGLTWSGDPLRVRDRALPGKERDRLRIAASPADAGEEEDWARTAHGLLSAASPRTAATPTHRR